MIASLPTCDSPVEASVIDQAGSRANAKNRKNICEAPLPASVFVCEITAKEIKLDQEICDLDTTVMEAQDHGRKSNDNIHQ